MADGEIVTEILDDCFLPIPKKPSANISKLLRNVERGVKKMY